jgi:capsular polysaccharide biosynthesis protein
LVTTHDEESSMAGSIGHDPGTERRGSRLGEVAVGVVVAAIVLGLGLAVLATRPPTWTARSTLLVVPTDPKSAVAAGFYETIAEGQVIATFAEILRGSDLQQQVASRSGLSASSAPSVSVQVVPGTALIRIDVKDASRSDAGTMAAGLAGAASAYVLALNQPFQLSDFRSVGLTKSTSLKPVTFMTAVALIALALGYGAARVYRRADAGRARQVSTAASIGPHRQAHANLG